MDNLALILIAVALGAYFSDEIRDKVPALDRNQGNNQE